MCVVAGMCFALDPAATTIIPPIPEPIPCPCDESTWHAVTESEWRAARRIDSTTGSVDMWTLVKGVIHDGQIPDGCGRVNAFTLLAVIGALQCTICTRQRLTLDLSNSCDAAYVSKMEQALATWEGLWRRHPRAEQSSTRLDDPLLNDCLSMLGSAYYHLYVGEELVALKRIAEHPDCGLALPKCENRSQALKVIKYASNSWLVRAKIGVQYLSKTEGLDLGSQALSAVYENGESPAPSDAKGADNAFQRS